MNDVTTQDVRSFLVSYLAGYTSRQSRSAPVHLDDDCDILLSGLIDSLGVLELITALNAFCGREIDFDTLNPEHLTVVGPLCRFVADQACQS